MIAEQITFEQVKQYGPYIMLGTMWLILFVVIRKSLSYSSFGDGAGTMIAICSATLAMYGGYKLYEEAALPAYVAMGMAILLGIVAIIRGGFKKIQRDSKDMQSDDDSDI